MTHAALLNEPESAPWPRGVLASYENVTPPRSDEQNRRSTDASKITFNLQLVLMIAGGLLTIAGTVYGAMWAANSHTEAANAAIRLDIAVIRQAQADQSKVDDYKAKLEEANRQLLVQSLDTVKADINAVRGQVQLAIIDIGNIRREMPGGVRK